MKFVATRICSFVPSFVVCNFRVASTLYLCLSVYIYIYIYVRAMGKLDRRGSIIQEIRGGRLFDDSVNFGHNGISEIASFGLTARIARASSPV